MSRRAWWEGTEWGTGVVRDCGGLNLSPTKPFLSGTTTRPVSTLKVWRSSGTTTGTPQRLRAVMMSRGQSPPDDRNRRALETCPRSEERHRARRSSSQTHTSHQIPLWGPVPDAPPSNFPGDRSGVLTCGSSPRSYGTGGTGVGVGPYDPGRTGGGVESVVISSRDRSGLCL